MPITIRSLTKRYAQNKPEIFKDFKMTFEKGKIYAILGKSGSGKTTLLNAMAGTVDCEADMDRDGVSYVFQQDVLIEGITVKNNVKLAVNAKDKKEKDEIALKYLKLTEIDGYADEYPDQLSGGERQRVSIARALAHNFETLLMDEPFNSLDYGVKKRIMNTVCDAGRQSGRTVIIATHDVDEALYVADEIYLLHGVPAQLTLLAEISEPRENRNIYDERFSRLKKSIIEKLEQN